MMLLKGSLFKFVYYLVRCITCEVLQPCMCIGIRVINLNACLKPTLYVVMSLIPLVNNISLKPL
jgi:hypothetical protein